MKLLLPVLPSNHKRSIEALLGEDEGEILNILQQTTSEIVNKVRAETILDTYDTIPEFLHNLPLTEKTYTMIRDDCKVEETLQVEKSELQQIDFPNTDYAETVSESVKSVSPIKCEDDIIAKSSVGDFGEVEHLIKEPLLLEDHQQSKSDDSVTESEPIKSNQVLFVEQVLEIAANLQENLSGIEHPIPLEITVGQNIDVPEYLIISPSTETWSTMKHDNIKISETGPLYKSKESNILHSSTDFNDDLEESLDYIYATERVNNVVSKILQKEVAEMEKLNIKQPSISSEFDIASEPLVTSTTFTPKSIIATSLGEDESGIIKTLPQTTSGIDNKVHEETILDPYETIPKFTDSFLPSNEKSITIIRDDYKFVDSLHVKKSELQHIDFSITDYTETTGDSVKSVSPIKCVNDIITKSLTKNFGEVEHKTKESLLSEFDRQSKSVDLNTASKSVNSAQVVLRDDQETEIATILQKPFSDTEHQVPLEVAEEQNVAIPEYSIISPSSETCVTIEHDDIKISETLPLLKSKASKILSVAY